MVLQVHEARASDRSGAAAASAAASIAATSTEVKRSSAAESGPFADDLLTISVAECQSATAGTLPATQARILAGKSCSGLERRWR